MIVGTIAEEITPFEDLRLALVGKEKSGKSRVTATGRKNVLVLDFDQRKESIAGFKGVFPVTFHDAQWPDQPTAHPELLDIITQLEESLDISKLKVGNLPVFPNLEKEAIIRTITFDSIRNMAKHAMAYELFNNSDLRRAIKSKGSGNHAFEVHVPRSFDGWIGEVAMVEQVLMRAFAIPKLDVIITLHEANEEAPGSTTEHPTYTGKITVFPVRYARILGSFNETWRMQLVADINNPGYEVPMIQTRQTAEFAAGTCLAVPGLVDPDITKLIKTHEYNQLKQQQGGK